MKQPYNYEIFDWSLDSNVPIPELKVCSENSLRQKYRFVVDRQSQPRADVAWTPLWKTPEGEVWLNVSISSLHSYALRFPDFAEFKIVVEDSETPNVSIACVPVGATPDETIRHLLLDQVIPLVLSCLRHIVMHMAVVRVEDFGIGFLGASGQGKSTLTAEFSRNGFDAVSDDTVLFANEDDTVFAVPNYSGIRLWRDSHKGLLGDATYASASHYNNKRRIASEDLQFTSDRVPLAALYVLETPDLDSDNDVRTKRLGFAESVKRLIESKFRLITDDKKALKDEFQSLSDICDCIPCFAIAYPREFDRIGEVRETLVAHASGLRENG